MRVINRLIPICFVFFFFLSGKSRENAGLFRDFSRLDLKQQLSFQKFGGESVAKLLLYKDKSQCKLRTARSKGKIKKRGLGGSSLHIPAQAFASFHIPGSCSLPVLTCGALSSPDFSQFKRGPPVKFV